MNPNDPHDRFRPTGPDESRPVPPHGPVSPDGRHVWPQPSQTARVVVYGGVVLGAAGLTAAAVLLGRRRMGSDGPARPAAAPPVFAPLPEPPPAPTVAPRPRRRPARHPVRRLADLTHAVRDASGFITMALAGFRSVANNAEGLSQQFHGLADAWRAATRDGKEAAAPGRRDFRAGPRDPAPGSDRFHRL